MSQRPKRLQQKAWDAENAVYASLSHPEWLDEVPKKFWEDPHNHNRYMKWLSDKLGVKKPEDWYRFHAYDFTDNHGASFLTYYDAPGSHINAIKAYHPRHEFLEWLFPTAPAGFWDEQTNRHRYRDWLGKRLGYKKVNDWYQLTQNDLIENYAGGLLDRFAASPAQIIRDFFPNEDWKPWRFVLTENGFWDKRENRREYMRWLEKQLGYKKPEDWYQVSVIDFNTHCGGSLISYYRYDYQRLIEELYPDRQWYSWFFSQVRNGFWKQKSNRKLYMRWLGEKLGFETFEDWLQLRSLHLHRNHGHQLLVDNYENDLTRIVNELFPRKQCWPWMMHTIKNGYWDEPENRKTYLEWLGKQLGFKQQEDWYSLSPRNFSENYGARLRKYGSICELVMEAFPEKKWLPWRFTRVPRGFWNTRANRNWYFDWLAKQLKVSSLKDWDQIRERDLKPYVSHSLRATVFDGQTKRLIDAARNRFKALDVRQVSRC